MKNLILIFLALFTTQAVTAQSNVYEVKNNCMSRLEGEIDVLEGKMTKQSLLAHLLVGASSGGVVGLSGNLNIRSKYSMGYEYGYADGSQTENSESDFSSSRLVFEKENVGTNVAIGAGVGIAAGAGVYFARKLVIGSSKKELSTLLDAYSLLEVNQWNGLVDDSLDKLNKTVFTKKDRKDLNQLKDLLIEFGNAYCLNPTKSMTANSLKKFSKYTYKLLKKAREQN